jgi:hypothetical protein
MRGQGHGAFLPGLFTLQNLSPDAVAPGDFNGDGNPDLALSSADSPSGVTLLLGQGDGSISTPVSVLAGVTAMNVTMADLNGDSKPDLVVRNASGISILINTTK